MDDIDVMRGKKKIFVARLLCFLILFKIILERMLTHYFFFFFLFFFIFLNIFYFLVARTFGFSK